MGPQIEETTDEPSAPNEPLHCDIDNNSNGDEDRTSSSISSIFHQPWLHSSSRHSDFTAPTSNIKNAPPSPSTITDTRKPAWRSIFDRATRTNYRIANSEENNDNLKNSKQLWPDTDGQFVDDRALEIPLDTAYQIQISLASAHRNDSQISQLHWDTDDTEDDILADSAKEASGTTTHAQSLLIGLVFLGIWSSSNIIAPHLTDVAIYFELEEGDRDLLLGSYLALVTNVLSLPLGAALGVWSDFTNHRRYLLGATALLAGGSCLVMGLYVRNYGQLLAARWLLGGAMGGSVPVVFSLISDMFQADERNIASSGLTAMMGLGIIVGQVGSGLWTGQEPGHNWQAPFVVSGVYTCIIAVVCSIALQEPIRGGKEPVLQNLLKAGTQYDRPLQWKTFWRAMNKSNLLLLWQGFFSSLPWGVIFVFLNDYLSQERGFSVPDATYIVLLFGLGCAAGGILGGYWGQLLVQHDGYLPIFMGVTTILAVVPFYGLLNSNFTNAHGFQAFLYSFGGGLVASLPSVNVRPCLMNVNPPETRGASLTAANLLINIGRGVGPSCITALVSMTSLDRQGAFNWTLTIFWIISGFQLFLLARTLPRDQLAMEAELASYAEEALQQLRAQEPESAFVLEDGISTWDDKAARETLTYVRKGVEELNHVLPFHCGTLGETESSASSNDFSEDIRWNQNKKYPSEQTPLI